MTEQEVLEDSTGLHWNAGPFLLIYSRAETPEADEVRLPWPPKLKVNFSLAYPHEKCPD